MFTLERRAEIDGQPVAWTRFGEGPPVVLIHGFPWSAQCWRGVAPRLSARRTVYLFDMPGAGQSGAAPGQDVSPQAQSRTLVELLRAWGLSDPERRPELIGHDFGGLAALRAVFVHGVEIAALTLIDAVAVLPSGSPFFAHVRAHEAAFAGLPPYAHDALFRAYIQKAAARPLAPETQDLYAAPWASPEGRASFYAHIAQSNAAAIEEAQARYRPLAVPTHLIWGAADTFIPEAQGRELEAAIGADRFTRVAGAGHLIQEDAPETLIDALLGPDSALSRAA